MSATAVTRTTCSLRSLHDLAYELKIEFTHKDCKTSSCCFTFQREKEGMGEIVDLITKNSSFNAKKNNNYFIKSIFNKTDVQSSEKALKIFNTMNTAQESDIIAVFDLQNRQGAYYGQKGEIVEKEEAIRQYLCAPPPQRGTQHNKQLHKLFQEKVNYLLFEGRLKSDLLEKGALTTEQIEYLNGESDGKRDLCQLTEYFMNGLKFGDTVKTDSSHLLHSSSYIYPLNPVGDDYTAHSKSSVFYPQQYAQMYCEGCSYIAQIHNCFAVSRQLFEREEITQLITERKTI